MQATLDSERAQRHQLHQTHLSAVAAHHEAQRRADESVAAAARTVAAVQNDLAVMTRLKDFHAQQQQQRLSPTRASEHVAALHAHQQQLASEAHRWASRVAVVEAERDEALRNWRAAEAREKQVRKGSVGVGVGVGCGCEVGWGLRGK